MFPILTTRSSPARAAQADLILIIWTRDDSRTNSRPSVYRWLFTHVFKIVSCYFLYMFWNWKTCLHYFYFFVQVYVLIGLLRRKANVKLSIRVLSISMQTEAPHLASEFIYVRAAASQWIRYSQYWIDNTEQWRAVRPNN